MQYASYIVVFIRIILCFCCVSDRLKVSPKVESIESRNYCHLRCHEGSLQEDLMPGLALLPLVPSQRRQHPTRHPILQVNPLPETLRHLAVLYL